MMNVILKNGSVVTVSSDKEIIEIVEEYCGHEVAEIVRGKIDINDFSAMYAQKRAESDADAYLEDIRSREYCLEEVEASARILLEYLKESKRIKRETCIQKVQEIIKQIQPEF